MSVGEGTPDPGGACGEGPQISGQKGWVPRPRELSASPARPGARDAWRHCPPPPRPVGLGAKSDPGPRAGEDLPG